MDTSRKAPAELDESLGTPGTTAPSHFDSDTVLLELENRCAELRAELVALESRLRELRVAADLCPRCGGVGEVTVRGGLYGELHQRPCQCQTM